MTRILKVLTITLVVLSQLPAGAADGELRFEDVERQTAEFMRYNDEIELSEAQDQIFREALTPLPAPCCSDRSALTCCCPCNQARTWWGLTKHLIANLDYDVERTRAKVAEWFEFTHPHNAPEGRACYSGRCPLPFEKDGCGGMRPDQVAF